MGMIYRGLTFDGVNSLDYGIYITGDGVYNAPTRDVEMITIAGRNGEYALDKGRFNNISVTYKAGSFAKTQTEFAEKISDFRNAILSRVGYKRLEDDYHPDEFRMAVYMNGLEVDPVHYSEAGEFELTFDCKPQRFLKSGEVKQTLGEWGETETASGEIATFEAEADTGIKSLAVDIEPIQSGTGDPSPTNVRPISGWDTIVVSHSGEDTTDPQTINKSLGQTVYGGTLDFISGVLTVTHGFKTFNGSENWVADGTTRYSVGVSDAYKNGYTRIEVLSNEGLFASSGSAVGTIFMSNKQLYYYPPTSVTSLANFKTWLASNPLEVRYILDTPLTYQLTTEQIETLLGVNNIWADSGEVSIEYGADPNILVNPTLFESHPLLEVRGYGAINMGDESVVIHNEPVGRVNLAVTQTILENTASTFEFSVAINDPTVYQTGDEITFLTVTVQMKLNGSVYRAEISDKSNMGARVNGSGSGTMLYLDIPTLIAESGVDGATYTAWADVTIKTSPSASPYTVRYSLSVLWDDDTNTMTYTLTLPDPSPLTYTPAQTYVGQSTARADSTKPSLGDPLYIDLDIGEAYKIEGTVIPINSAVEIPAELPTLKAGANLITYDDTITQLDITPRYWKI